MISSKEILVVKQKVLIALSKKQLKDAFDSLRKLVIQTQDWKHTDKLNELENNYKYMLHYMFEGFEDPNKTVVYNEIARSTYELIDDVADELLTINSNNYFFDRLRINAVRSDTLANYATQLEELSSSLSLVDLLESGEEKINQKKDIAIKRERIGVNLFQNLYTSPRASKAEREDYLHFLNNIEIPTREKCLLISALTLNIFHRFDMNKIKVLLEAAMLNDRLVKTRAIVGLVIILQMYDNRWSLYPELQNRLETLSENNDFKKNILRIIIQLIRARDTERISQKMSDEIIPQMMKFSSLAGKKISLEDLMGETDFMEKNPEWEKEIKDSGLNKKLQEYSELQMEGADVFHSTFANLKHFPFFSEMSNWFLPFDRSYSQISELYPDGENESMLTLAIVESGHMCNSDKYSFSFSILQAPAAQRQMMMSHMGAESEQIKQMQKEAQAMNPRIDEEVMSNQYIQDLYRFYKLFSRKDNFFDVFKLSINFYSKQALLPQIGDLESMNQIANYCFDKNNFDIALSIFEKIVEQGAETETTWQKIGYCQQAQNNNKEALAAYIKSDLIAPRKTWTLRRIAQLYRTLGKPKEASDYFKKALEITPNNLNIELNIGHCYLEMGKPEEAQNQYFKVEMLDSKSNRAYRPIAWTVFLLKKYDVAERYYFKILETNATMHDYLNAGHVQLVGNKNQKALEYYRDASLLADDMDHFISLIDNDKKILTERGVAEDKFSYIFDKIKYMLD